MIALRSGTFPIPGPALLAGLVLLLFLAYPYLPWVEAEQRVVNGSFEQGLNGWRVQSPPLLTGQSLSLPDQPRYPLDPSQLDHPFRFQYLPVRIDETTSWSFLHIHLSTPSGRRLARIHYLLNGPDRPDVRENHFVGQGVLDLTFIRHTEVGFWNTVTIDSILEDLNRGANQAWEGAIKGCSAFTLKDIGHAEISLQTWPDQRPPVEVYFRNLPVARTDALEKRRPCDADGTGCLEAVHHLPSQGERYARTQGGNVTAFTQWVTGLAAGRPHLLLFDTRNESGLLPPTVEIRGCRGEPLAQRSATMQMAQTGWVRSGLLFTPPATCVRLALGKVRDPKARYANHFDNIRLYRPPMGAWIGTESYFRHRFDVAFDATAKVKEVALPLDQVADDDFMQGVERAVEGLGLPQVAMEVDEAAVWAAGKPTDNNWWSHRISGKFKDQPAGWVTLDGERHPAKFKPRGTMSYHHATRTRSWQVALGKNKRLDLIRPCTRSFLAEAYSTALARAMGLLALKDRFVFLTLNRAPIGPYWEVARGEENLELGQHPAGYLLALREGTHYILERSPQLWKSLTPALSDAYGTRYPPDRLVTDLLTLLRTRPVQELGDLLPAHSFLRWNAHAILMGTAHQDQYHNILLYWNSALGTLEPVPWDVRGDTRTDMRPWDTARPYGEDSLLSAHFNPAMDPFLNDWTGFEERNRILWDRLRDPAWRAGMHTQIDTLYRETREAFRQSREYECPHNPADSMDFIPFSAIDRTNRALLEGLPQRMQSLHATLSASNDYLLEVSPVKKLSAGKGITYRFHLTPRNNNAIPSLRLTGLKFTAPKAISALWFEGETTPRQLDETGRISMERALASDVYLTWRIRSLWRDEFETLRQRLADFPEERALLEAHYQPVGNLHDLKPESLADAAVRDRLVQLFQRAGLIRVQRDFTFYATVRTGTWDRPTFAVTPLLENSVTGAAVALAGRALTPPVAETPPVSAAPIPTVPPPPVETVLESLAWLQADGAAMAKRFPFLRPDSDQPGRWLVPPGEHTLPATLVVPRGVTLQLTPGATLRFAPEASLIAYGRIEALGTAEAPVRFLPLHNNGHWGVVGMIGAAAGGHFRHALLEGGGEAYFNGIHFTGMLAAHYADLTLEDAVLRRASVKGGDEALNVKKARAVVTRTLFQENASDALDFDFVQPGSAITGSLFLDNGNDGVDISGSTLTLTGNVIGRSGNKGISLGEGSQAEILDTRVFDAPMGLAVKDSSRVTVTRSAFQGHRVGVAAYRKKTIYTGGTVFIRDTRFEDNSMDLGAEYRPGLAEGQPHSGPTGTSHITIRDSRYRLTGAEQVEITRAPKKSAVTSKKQLLRLLGSGELDTVGYRVARLQDDRIEERPDSAAPEEPGPRPETPLPSLERFSWSLP